LTGGVAFATSTAPMWPFAELVSNPTPPGKVSRVGMLNIGENQIRLRKLKGKRTVFET
jgi:hypothetical protein